MAELALGLAGAAVAGIPGVGVTALTGFQIGATIGSLLYPPTGPRLDRGRVDEVRIQGAAQGSPIAMVFGRNRVAGTVIWTTGVTERSRRRRQGGKGGGGGQSAREYSYSVSLAVAICEGPLQRVRRIWANEQVVYDWRTGTQPTIASWLNPDRIRVYLGTQTSADPAIEAQEGAGAVPAFKGIAYAVFEEFPLAEVGNQVPSFSFEVESAHADLEAAMLDVARRAGLEPNDCDFSELAGMPTRGLVVSARTEAARIMDTFARANLFDIVESGGVLRAVRRTGVPVAEIPREDIGAGSDSNAPPHVETVRAEESELPRELTVAYQSERADFQQWTQTARRIVRYSDNQEQESFPMALGDEYARYLADALLMERWASRARHTFSVGWKHLALEPGDVVRIPDEGGGQRSVRITETSIGLLAQIEVTAVDDDPSIYADPGLPAALPGEGGEGVQAAQAAELAVIETNAPFDELAGAPQIGIAAGRSAPGWRGGVVQTSPRLARRGYRPLRQIAEFESGSTFGRTVSGGAGILGIGGPVHELLGGIDTANTVRVELVGGELESCTIDEMVREERNLCAIGEEILQFATAAPLGGGVYELSTFIRFRRGTDYLYSRALFGQAVHGSGETFVMFDEGARAYEYDPRHIGQTHQFRLIEAARDYGGGMPPYGNAIQLRGLARRPYGPCQLAWEGDRSAGPAPVRLSWVRRVRTGGDLQDYADAPLDEAAEAYVVEVWSQDLAQLLGTFQANGAAERTLTVAEQTALGIQAAPFQFVVYQVSSAPGIGRGHPSLPCLVGLQ
jgi:hypothetical protein